MESFVCLSPLFSSLMGMQGEMLKNLSQGGATPTTEESGSESSPDTRKIHLDNSSHNPNVVKERLQRKLKEKKNMTVEKID